MYFAPQTTNENHADFPTPYLCLRARLSQCIINRYSTGLVLPIVTLLFFQTVYLKSLEIGCTSQEEVTSWLYAYSNEYKESYLTQYKKDILMENERVFLRMNQVINETVQSVNNSIEFALSNVQRGVPDFTSNFTVFDRKYQADLKNSLNGLLIAFQEQNSLIERIRFDIETQAISVNQQIDYSGLTLNYTWLEGVFGYLNNSFINSSKALEKYISSHVADTRSYERLLNMKASVEPLQRNLSQISTEHLNRINKSVEGILTSMDVTNISFNARLLQDPKTRVKEKSHKYILMLLILSALIIVFQACKSWVLFQLEQSYSKLIKHQVNLTENHLAVAHHTTDPLTSIVSYYLVKALQNLSYLRRTYFEEHREVRIHWLVSYFIGTHSFVPDLVFNTFVGIISYMAFADTFNPYQERYTSLSSAPILDMHLRLDSAVRSLDDRRLEIINTHLRLFYHDIQITLQYACGNTSLQVPGFISTENTHTPSITIHNLFSSIG